jgi:hypothetical protein
MSFARSRAETRALRTDIGSDAGREKACPPERTVTLIELVICNSRSGIVMESDTVRHKTLDNFRKAAEVYRHKLLGAAPDRE